MQLLVKSFMFFSIFSLPLELKTPKILHLGIKKNKFFCSALDFSYLCTHIRE